MINGDNETTGEFIEGLVNQNGRILAAIESYFVVRYGESNAYHIFAYNREPMNVGLRHGYETGDFLRERKPKAFQEVDIWTTYDHPKEEDIKLYAHGRLRRWVNDEEEGEE